jgi:serine/threonine-protein kinase
MIRIGMFLGDRYEILEKIGSGGMAEVFKGKDHKLNRFVAVKVLKDEFVEDKNFVRKFKEEAQAAAALAHPNIVNVYDVGDEQNVNYIVMELVEGITLKTYIEKKGKLTVKEATSIAIQVGAGLEVAHNNQIVHRDIKPQNIIISREGKVKVTDFGIAKSVSSNTNTSDAMGSVHYTSPEQARGGYSDAKSDIYSLGIVMYEMVTGRVPFDGDTTVVVAVKHLQEDIVSPRVYASEVPVSLEHIILKCTEKSPDRRYANVAELVADLKQSLVTPDVNFVKEILPGGAKTVAITREEISRIKKETGRIPTEEGAEAKYAYLDHLGEDPDAEFDEDFDSDDYDSDDYDPEDEDYDSGNGDEDDDDEGGILDPKLEKIMTIGGIVAAVIIVIIIIFIIAKIFGIGKSSKNTDDNNDIQIEDVLEDDAVEVPDLLGMSYSEAKEALNELSLGIQLGETRTSDEYEPGQIIGQSVDAGTQVDPNTTIVVDICGDGAEIEVLDVLGYTQKKAVAALEELGFSVDVTEVYDNDVSEGNVISTSPKAGSKASRGSVIKVIVSKGPEEEEEQVTVPTIEGLSEANAKAALVKANLASGTVTQDYSDTVEEGKVISQSVKSGTKVAKDTAISYVVSKGKKVTDVYIGNAEQNGSSESAVTNYLTKKGLVVSRSEAYSSSVAKGNVISYSPGNGSTVQVGSTVNIVVSLGPEPVKTATVPSLTGKTRAEAQSALEAVGLKAAFSEEYSDSVTADYVLSQSIASGSTVDQGTTVNVVVSKGSDPTGNGGDAAPSSENN